MPQPDAKPSARTPRTDRRTTETRERILEVAEQQIALHGVEGFQIKAVAEAVGIRPPSVFAHFRGREDIAAEVAVRIVSRLGQVMHEAFAGRDDALDALRSGVRALVRHLAENPAHVRLLLRDLAQADAGEAFSEVGRVIAEIGVELTKVLELGCAQGVFRRVDVHEMLPLLEGAILARIAWHGFEPSGRPRLPGGLERLERELGDLVLAYVRAPELDRG